MQYSVWIRLYYFVLFSVCLCAMCSFIIHKNSHNEHFDWEHVFNYQFFFLSERTNWTGKYRIKQHTKQQTTTQIVQKSAFSFVYIGIYIHTYFNTIASRSPFPPPFHFSLSPSFSLFLSLFFNSSVSICVQYNSSRMSFALFLAIVIWCLTVCPNHDCAVIVKSGRSVGNTAARIFLLNNNLKKSFTIEKQCKCLTDLLSG